MAIVSQNAGKQGFFGPSGGNQRKNRKNLRSFYYFFMQNKANFRKSQMNVNPYNTTYYENKSNWTLGENKPNSNPNKANLKNRSQKTEVRKQKTEYGPPGYGEGLCRDESGLVPAKRGPLAMTVPQLTSDSIIQ